jgi:hypothetical protein
MLTDLNLVFLKSLGGLSPLPYSWLRQCYTVIIEKKYQIMGKFSEVFKNNRKIFLKVWNNRFDKTYRLDDIYSFGNFSKSWIKFIFILEKLSKFIFSWKKSKFFLLMEYKKFFSPFKTRIKLNNSLWINVTFFIILDWYHKNQNDQEGDRWGKKLAKIEQLCSY